MMQVGDIFDASFTAHGRTVETGTYRVTKVEICKDGRCGGAPHLHLVCASDTTPVGEEGRHDPYFINQVPVEDGTGPRSFSYPAHRVMNHIRVVGHAEGVQADLFGGRL